MYNEYDHNYYDEREEARPFLHAGEEILWTGRPYAGTPYRPPVYSIFFSAFFLGFALFWTAMASMAGAFALFGLPFVAVGAWLMYHTVFGIKKRMKNTLYVVTDRRALIISRTRHGTDCAEHVFTRMQGVSVESIRGDAGTIRLREIPLYDGDMYYGRRRGRYNTAMAEAEMRATFQMIDDVQTVYRLISERITEG